MMVGMDHDESKPRRRWPTYLAVALLLLFVVYPLSVGPVIATVGWIDDDNRVLSRATLLFYAPLFSASEMVGGGNLLSAYIVWCTKVATSGY